MLLEGLRLMVVGMTTVFAFLGILVVAMQANRAVASLIPERSSDRAGTLAPVAPENGDEALAVVLAAVAAARGTR